MSGFRVGREPPGGRKSFQTIKEFLMNPDIVHKKGRSLVGTVVSDKNDKTIIVRVETLFRHPVLKKFVRRHKKFTAHDPGNECGMGDTVRIIEYRPLSRNKRWHLVSVLEKAV
jgi:small subunit ribosomal protein S17